MATSKMELKKAMSKKVLYTGLIIIAIGIFFLFVHDKGYKISKLSPLSLPLIFIGFIVSVFWVSNRKDEMCPTSIDDNRDCVPV